MLYYNCNKGVYMTPKVLLLNNENEPFQVCSWKQAILLMIKGKAEALKSIDELDSTIKNGEVVIPNIIRLNFPYLLVIWY